MMKYVLLTVFFQAVYAACPNGCSGHGDCNKLDQCTCFNEEAPPVFYYASDKDYTQQCFKAGQSGCAGASTSGYSCFYVVKDAECKRVVREEQAKTLFPEWQGADCSRRTCPRSTSWSEYGPTETGKTYRCTHQVDVECSDQGLCDRATGLCECFPGFTGNACQRTACPDDCSGHGTCRSNRDFAYDFAVAKTHQFLLHSVSTKFYRQNYKVTYDSAWDANHFYGCHCDKGYRGANCALIECPSSNDPLDDKCKTSEKAEDVENFQVQKFAATGELGWEQAYALSVSPTPYNAAKHQVASDPCNVQANIDDDTGAKCLAVVGLSGQKCKFTPKVTANPSASPPVIGAAAKCEMETSFNELAPGDKNNHFYAGKVYACFGAMAGQDCSGRGVCDYSTGQCACFSGYSGTSCSDIEELF